MILILLSRPLRCCRPLTYLMGTLSKDVFEQRTSTGNEAFPLLICLDATKFVLLSVSTLMEILMETIYPKVQAKTLPKNEESPLAVDVLRSKTCLLKLPQKTFLESGKNEVPHRGKLLLGTS